MSGVTAPFVSVIVPHYSDLRRLDLCLAALDHQSYPRDAFEIIVADNNSPEGIEAVTAVVAGRARLTLVLEKGPGLARNGAVALANGEALAFTDSDCLPETEWLAKGVAALADHDLAGGRIRVLVEDVNRITPAEAFEIIFAFDNESYVRRQGFSVTANLFCRKTVFDDIGGFFDWVATEDLEWCHRARAAGYRLGYAPDAIIGHPARRAWSDLIKKTQRGNIGLYARMAERRGGRFRWLLKSLAMPLSALAHTPKALLDPNLRGLGQRFQAVVALYRIRTFRMTDGLRLLMSG